MIYLGLGSNQNDRRQNLAAAIEQLAHNGFTIKRISPVVESPAMLKVDAKPEWNRPYLNLVLEGETNLSPTQLLLMVKKIEQALGRDLAAPRWSMRTIDIDILLWHQEKIKLPDLCIPHSELHKRAFVITPLNHLVPHLRIPGVEMSVMQLSQKIRPIPLWMGIVNLTPDSFSDGGAHDDLEALEATLSDWINAGVHVLDFGAQSTRPEASSVSPETEWERLEPVFFMLDRLRKAHSFMPLISLDTYYPGVAKAALACGANWINDVTGLCDPEMGELVSKQNATAIAMHSLSVPVVAGEAMDLAIPVHQQLEDWLAERAENWERRGLDLGRLIFDPGIGFGKTSLQNLAILKASSKLRELGFRVLIGHSRKSFMSSFTDENFADRDMETLGISLAMCAQGVDVMRVHDPLSHIRAYRAWSHVQAHTK